MTRELIKDFGGGGRAANRKDAPLWGAPFPLVAKNYFFGSFSGFSSGAGSGDGSGSGAQASREL